MYLVVQGRPRSLWGIERGGEGFCRTYAKYLVLPSMSSTPQGDNLCVYDCVEWRVCHWNDSRHFSSLKTQLV